MNIVIYSKSNCPNCTTAKRLLDDKGIGYEERDAEDVVVFMNLMEQYPEVRQMPQIFINNQRVGGTESTARGLLFTRQATFKR